MIDARHNGSVRPCFDIVSEKACVVQGQVEALSVIQELLELQIGNYFTLVSVTESEEIMSDLLSVVHIARVSPKTSTSSAGGVDGLVRVRTVARSVIAA